MRKYNMKAVVQLIHAIMRSKFRLVNWRAVYAERCTYGSEGGIVKSALGTK